uniref:Uncharacterized protein n=1 Tax=Aegilops tauschii subsp. strangulata TaxID=200361 RepID=A0A453C1N8_AEGTS
PVPVQRAHPPVIHPIRLSPRPLCLLGLVQLPPPLPSPPPSTATATAALAVKTQPSRPVDSVTSIQIPSQHT